MAASLLAAKSLPACGFPQTLQPNALFPEYPCCSPNLNSNLATDPLLSNHGRRLVTRPDSCTIKPRKHRRAAEASAQYSSRPSHYNARRRRARSTPGPTSSPGERGFAQSEEAQGLGISSRWQHSRATPGCSQHPDAGNTFETAASDLSHTAGSILTHSAERRSAYMGGYEDPLLRGVGDMRGGCWDPLGVQPIQRFASTGGDGNGGSQGGGDEASKETTSTSKSPAGLSSLDAYFEKLNASKTGASDSSSPSSSLSPPSTSSESGVASGLGAPTQGTAVSSSLPGQGSGPGLVGEILSKAEDDPEAANAPKATKALRSLDAYFDKLRPPPPPAPKELPPPAQPQQATKAGKEEGGQKQLPDLPPELRDNPEFQKLWGELENWAREASKGEGTDPSKLPVSLEVKTFMLEQPEFEKWVEGQKAQAAPWAINLFITLNIAVYILELGSPELVPDNIMTSLPSLYMAKVNQLILDGEWWRIITPSFLHSGFFHLLISVWTLWSLGPQVEVALGAAGFIGAFLVGGAFGNLLSFFANDQIAVGGTGPIFALVGAWIVYLYKNRDVVGKEWADGEIWKVTILAGLNLALGSPPPIDDWTHVGALVGGAFYALLAAPKLTRIVTKKKATPKMTMFGQFNPSSGAKEEEDVMFLAEGPGTKQHFWIYALCTGVLVAVYQVGTVALSGAGGLGPQDLFI